MIVFFIFKRNNCRVVQNVYQEKVSMAKAFNEFKYLTSSCWGEKYQHLTIGLTQNKYTGLYRLRLNSLFVPNTNPFENNLNENLYYYNRRRFD